MEQLLSRLPRVASWGRSRGDLWGLLGSQVGVCLPHPFSVLTLTPSTVASGPFLGCHPQLTWPPPSDQDSHLPGTTELEDRVSQIQPQLFQNLKSGQLGQDSMGSHCSG